MTSTNSISFISSLFINNITFNVSDTYPSSSKIIFLSLIGISKEKKPLESVLVIDDDGNEVIATSDKYILASLTTLPTTGLVCAEMNIENNVMVIKIFIRISNSIFYAINQSLSILDKFLPSTEDAVIRPEKSALETPTVVIS